MSSTTVLNPQTASFVGLMGNGKSYHVPLFQRDYSWGEPEWEDLWFDLVTLETGQIHYMGYAVLQGGEEKRLEIIDGQQRIATLSILSLAVIKLISDLVEPNKTDDPNLERAEILRNKFIGHKTASSLVPVSKLRLNRNNDDFYQSYILRLREPGAKHRLKPSERLLWEAFEFFTDQLRKHFKDNFRGEVLAQFLEDVVGEQLIFTVINVSNDLVAYRVFETLNARGVKLSATDLLKNFLFSVVARTNPANIEEAERQWQSINNTLGSEDLPTFVRHYWNSSNPLQRKQTLFKVIKSKIHQDQEAFALLEELEKFAPLEVALGRPDEPMWTKPQRLQVRALDLFSVSQFYPLVFSAWDYWQPDHLAELLRMCVVVSFRYNIISGLNPNTLEDVYNMAARKVASKESLSCAAVFADLKSVYVADGPFKSAFVYKTINTNGARWKRLIRYILVTLEQQASGAAAPHDFDAQNITIEHILPENPSAAWEAYFPSDEQDRLVYRLGNYTLLETSKNGQCGNKPFADKKAVYSGSSFQLAKNVCAFDDWTPEFLHKHQEDMAELAAAAWKLDY